MRRAKPLQMKFVDGELVAPKRVSTVMKRKLTEEERQFNKEKRKLHELHKRLRAGLLQWEDVDESSQALLKKYYGW